MRTLSQAWFLSPLSPLFTCTWCIPSCSYLHTCTCMLASIAYFPTLRVKYKRQLGQVILWGTLRISLIRCLFSQVACVVKLIILLICTCMSWVQVWVGWLGARRSRPFPPDGWWTRAMLQWPWIGHVGRTFEFSPDLTFTFIQAYCLAATY